MGATVPPFNWLALPGRHFNGPPEYARYPPI